VTAAIDGGTQVVRLWAARAPATHAVDALRFALEEVRFRGVVLTAVEVWQQPFLGGVVLRPPWPGGHAVTGRDRSAAGRV